MRRGQLTPEQKATAKSLVGKTIARVIMHPFDDCRPSDGDNTATDPILVFTDGSRLRFSTQETETGEYGTELILASKS